VAKLPDGSTPNAFSPKSLITYDEHYLCFPGGTFQDHLGEARNFLDKNCGGCTRVTTYFTWAGQRVDAECRASGFPISCGSAVEWRYDRPWTPAEIAQFFYRRCAYAAAHTYSDYTKAERRELIATARVAQPPPARRFLPQPVTVEGAPAPAAYAPPATFRCPAGWVPCVGLTGIRCFPAALCLSPATPAQAAAAGFLVS